jgi:hypothetical protein
VTTTLSPPIRILAIVGVLAVVAVGVLFFAHNRSSSDGSSASAPPVSQSTSKPATSPATGSPATTPAAKPAAKPRVVLLPNLPAPIARQLHFSKVVVAVIYSGNVESDRVALVQARAAAKTAHAGFAAVNVVNEKLARSAGAFAGTTTAPPTLLIVKRPGKIVNRFSGSADGVIVAQAAMNAGAGR